MVSAPCSSRLWLAPLIAGCDREAWGDGPGFEFAIASPEARSNAVTTVVTGDVDPETLRRLAEHQAGLVLGVPLTGFENRAFRIGHMGHLNPTMVLGTLGSIEAVVQGMQVPVNRSGVAAAAAHIATHLPAK